MEHFNLINKAIKSAITNPFYVPQELSGFSGEKLLSVLINLSKHNLSKENVYLEVGIYQGMSLLSVAYGVGHEFQVYGIDNFAFFDEDGQNEAIVHSRMNKLDLKNVSLINRDYEDALENLSEYIGDKKVGVYFIDGPHDYRSQLMCLLLIQPYLADDAIIIIDDCNYRHVRQANRDFLQTNSDFKLFFESYTKSHPQNMIATDEAEARKGWWNGVNIIIRDKENVVKRAYPPTIRGRQLYENEHILHSIKYPTLPLRLNKYIRWYGDVKTMFGRNSHISSGKFKNMNTYSEDLPEANFIVGSLNEITSNNT